MQRFLSVRLLSKNHPTSNGPSHIYNTFVSLAKTNLVYTKNAHASSGSQYSTTALSNSWVKPHKFFGILANPVVVSKVLQKSNALLKAPSTGLLDFKRVFPRSYFLQKRSFSSSSVRSQYSPVRKWFRRVDPDNLILVLIAANIAVFLMWCKADRQFMIENFTQSKQIGGRSPSSVPGLGASGALNAIMLLEILLNPKRIIFVEMILPVPALLAGVYLIGTDMLRP